MLLADSCRGQRVVATSSGEAELYAAVSTLKDMLLLRQALLFFKVEIKMELRYDSSAARAMLQRQGAGAVRHVEVATLWAQQIVKEKIVAVKTIASLKNPAGLGTKVHSQERFAELVKMLGLRNGGLDDEVVESLTVAPVETIQAPRALAKLLLLLSQVVESGGSVLVPADACEMVIKEDMWTSRVDRAWPWAALAIIIVGFVLGVVARDFWHRLLRRPKAQTRTMRIQAMTTYRRDLATPRFQFGAFDGAWED